MRVGDEVAPSAGEQSVWEPAAVVTRSRFPWGKSLRTSQASSLRDALLVGLESLHEH